MKVCDPLYQLEDRENKLVQAVNKVRKTLQSIVWEGN